MRIFKFKMVVLALASLMAGCGSIGSLYTYKGSGFLYTHRVEPLSRHYHPVQVGQADKDASGSYNQLSYQSVTIQWGDNAIGEIAKNGGIQTIYYADLETQSILFGIWSRNRIHIYGTSEVPKELSSVPEPGVSAP